MDIMIAKVVIWQLSKLGCSAVTITGGGEPLCHPDISEMLKHFKLAGIKIGLVTNGYLLGKLSREDLSTLTWCRISHSDERRLTDKYRNTLEIALTMAPQVDWAFSYVLSESPNVDGVLEIVDFANVHGFTHVRLVSDILHPTADFEPTRKALAGRDHRVIYQPRDTPSPANRCVIGYIKPVIAADFNIYMCCGVQYALDPPSRDMPEQLCMGNAQRLEEIYSRPFKIFETECVRCYYHKYNNLLLPIAEEICHKEFL